MEQNVKLKQSSFLGIKRLLLLIIFIVGAPVIIGIEADPNSFYKVFLWFVHLFRPNGNPPSK